MCIRDRIHAGLLFVGQLVVALAGKGKVNVLRPELVVIHLGNAVFKALEREVVETPDVYKRQDLARGIARADLLVGILILKQIDHGKTTLTAAITKFLACLLYTSSVNLHVYRDEDEAMLAYNDHLIGIHQPILVRTVKQMPDGTMGSNCLLYTSRCV